MPTSQGDASTGLPVRRVTANQLIGFNMTWFRRALGETQDAFGERLGGWSGATVSAAERSWDGRRVRKFDADEVVHIAATLGVPLIAMFLPPPDAGTAVDYEFDLGAATPSGLTELLADLALSYGLPETPALVAYRERLFAIGAPAAADNPVAAEVLRRALYEANTLLTKSRQRAEQVTSGARARAEDLERDAQERHLQAMSSLVQSREELERRVNDLRNFEREYRSRMLAYFEGMIRDLKIGAADSSAFPAFGGQQAGPRAKPPECESE